MHSASPHSSRACPKADDLALAGATGLVISGELARATADLALVRARVQGNAFPAAGVTEVTLHFHCSYGFSRSKRR